MKLSGHRNCVEDSWRLDFSYLSDFTFCRGILIIIKKCVKLFNFSIFIYIANRSIDINCGDTTFCEIIFIVILFTNLKKEEFQICSSFSLNFFFIIFFKVTQSL